MEPPQQQSSLAQLSQRELHGILSDAAGQISRPDRSTSFGGPITTSPATSARRPSHQHHHQQSRQPNDTRPPSDHGSAVSGGTVGTRTQKMAAQRRRLLLERVTKPLSNIWVLYVSTFLLLVSMSAGFAGCLQFFNATMTTINVQFYATREARKNAVALLENLRLMVYANVMHLPTEFASAVQAIGSSLADVSGAQIPIIAQYLASLPSPPQQFAMYSPVLQNGSQTIDYEVHLYSALGLLGAIVKASNIAMVYNAFGALTPAVWATVPELVFLQANWMEILAALISLPDAGINAYNTLVNNSTILLVVALCVSLALVCLNAFIALRAVCPLFYSLTRMKILSQILQVLWGYFNEEQQIQRLLLTMPRRTASTLLATIEEEIENFIEVTSGEDDVAEDQFVEFKTGSNDTGSRLTRHKKHFALVGGGCLLVGMLLVGVFAQTFTAVSLKDNLDRFRAFIIDFREK
ncbi:hypothetical protein BC828DRAFT_254515 [Blastocladiella britannica]|nr:hypothetical protein BC828DRAFT_254515 [Blastocladiella britannica]